MSVSESHQAEAQHRVEAAQVALRGLDATVSPTAGVVHGALAIAMNELDGAVSLLAAPGAIARIACRFCARMITPAATRCGFCWRALSHA
jgi:hypothetical protein